MTFEARTGFQQRGDRMPFPNPGEIRFSPNVNPNLIWGGVRSYPWMSQHLDRRLSAVSEDSSPCRRNLFLNSFPAYKGPTRLAWNLSLDLIQSIPDLFVETFRWILIRIPDLFVLEKAQRETRIQRWQRLHLIWMITASYPVMTSLWLLGWSLDESWDIW